MQSTVFSLSSSLFQILGECLRSRQLSPFVPFICCFVLSCVKCLVCLFKRKPKKKKKNCYLLLSDIITIIIFKYLYFFKEVQHPWALFLKTLCNFAKKNIKKIKQLWTKKILSIWSEMFQGTQKYSFTSADTLLLWSYSKKFAKINIFHVLSHKSITTWVSEIIYSSAVIRFVGTLPIRNISYLWPMCYNFWEKCINIHKIGQGCSTPFMVNIDKGNIVT